MATNPKNIMANYKGLYQGLEFPDYEYRHFPLMVWSGEGAEREHRTVNDEAELKAAEDEGFEAPNVGPPVHVTQTEMDAKDAEIAALKAQLAAKTPPKVAPTPAEPAEKK